jgi:hypothetical protein
MGHNVETNNPRDDAVRNWMEQYQRQHSKDKTEKFALRQNNQLLNVYTDDQFQKIQCYLLERGKMLDFRSKLDLCMGHFLLLRSQNRLAAELADIFILPMPNEGIRGAVNMLFFILRSGKVPSASCRTWLIFLRRRKLGR